MTFFANAGVQWPTLQSQLQQAGTQALSGGAELWQLFSKIEGWQLDQVSTLGDEKDVKDRCVKALRQAADSYSSNLDSIGTLPLDTLTPAEFDLAALPRRYYDDEYPYLLGLHFNARDLYRELIARIRNLASQVKTLDLGSDRRDLAAQIFRAMQAWELIASLARLIAVLNQRPEGSG
jgi:hypothetical protein